MVSISGLRGIVGESLTPEVIIRYATAFGEYCKQGGPRQPVVIIGRDGRSTGAMIGDLVSSSLLFTGVHVQDLGICPTPTVALAVERESAAGGIAVTASHNPMQWNGLKFFASTGLFLDGNENTALWAIERTPSRRYAGWDSIGTHRRDDSWIQKHLEAVLSLRYIRKDLIQRRCFKVVVDCVNAAGGVIVPHMLRELGCNVVEMNCDVSGVFAHTPEPLPENLVDLARRVTAERADLGIAVDPDVDRLVFITDRGAPYGEEYTIATATKFVLEREAATPGKAVVVNLSTTRAVDDIAASYGATVVRTPVGEINVAKKMQELGALIGGEGSGGVILPAVHLGRDAIVGIGLILQMLAEFDGTLSQLRGTLPEYVIAKDTLDIGSASPDTLLDRLRESAPGEARINTDDGLRIDYPDYWVHLRKSNTEPIIRVIAEARTAEHARGTVKKWKETIAATATKV